MASGCSVSTYYGRAIDGFQMSIKRPTSEGKRAIKRQLYSGPFTLRVAASFIFRYYGKDLM